MKYLSEKPLRLTVNGSYRLYNTDKDIELRVSGSKHIFIYVFLAALFEQDEKMPITLNNVPEISEVSFLYQYAVDAGAEVERNAEEKSITIHSGVKVNHISPAYVINCRSALIAFTLHAIRFGEASMRNDIGGCRLGERKIDQHCRLWDAIGYVFSEENTEMHLKRTKDHRSNDCFTFAFDTTMGTVAAIYALRHGGIANIENASTRYEIDELIRFYRCLGYEIERTGRSVEWKGSSDDRRGGTVFAIADDIDETIGWSCLCHALGKKGAIHAHIPRQYVWEWLELHSNGEILWTQDKIIVAPREMQEKKEELQIVASRDSGITSDQQPILAVWASCFYRRVRITDNKFRNRYDYVEELKKAGWQGAAAGNGAWIEKGAGEDIAEKPVLIANNLRSGFAVMMAILIRGKSAELLSFEQLKRGYASVPKHLECLGVIYQIENAPKSESVAVILQKADGSYYVQQRDPNAPKNPGKITLFGGHVEDGEASEQAIRRELQEELDLETDCELLEVFQVSRPMFSTSGLVYLYRAGEIGELNVCHEGKIALLNRQEIGEQDMSAFLRCVVEMQFL